MGRGFESPRRLFSCLPKVRVRSLYPRWGALSLGSHPGHRGFRPPPRPGPTLRPREGEADASRRVRGRGRRRSDFTGARIGRIRGALVYGGPGPEERLDLKGTALALAVRYLLVKQGKGRSPAWFRSARRRSRPCV